VAPFLSALSHEASVEYKIIAYDNFNNSAATDNQRVFYRYLVIPEFPSGVIYSILIGATLLTVIIIINN